MPVPAAHYISGHRLVPPFPAGMATALFGLGCFWGAERLFWEMPGVYSTMVGYAGGLTPSPTYREVCSDLTGHNEVVRVIYYPAVLDYRDLLARGGGARGPARGGRRGGGGGARDRAG